MNYKKIYDSLIERSKNRVVDGYFESHHIVPRCMGGSDEKENIAELTPEEHYLAHQLLVKIYPENKKLVMAAVMMRPKRPCNKLYGWLRRKHSSVMKEITKGENNSQFGTNWLSKDGIEKKVQREDIWYFLSCGWEIGRIKKEKEERTCKNCNKKIFCSGYYCSSTCKRHFRSPASKTIDENIDSMILVFLECKSIDNTLKTFGIEGVRAGNSYFSKIIKEKGIEPLVRRNKMPS